MLRGLLPSSLLLIAAGVVVVDVGACGPGSLIGQPCTPGTDALETCEGTARLICNGSYYELLATCDHDCVAGPGTTHEATELTADETWLCAEGPHLVTGNVTVGEGVTLTIEPGTEVRLQPTTTITAVEGARVEIDAAPGNEVLFTSDNGFSPGFGSAATGGLNVFATSAAEPSIVRGLIVERGNNGITVSGLSDRVEELPVIERCTLRDNQIFGILVNCETTDTEVPDWAASNTFFENAGGDVSSCDPG
ncbi:MAG TPA: hypothetical protein VGF99_21865 [Myxococcota bacterium]